MSANFYAQPTYMHGGGVYTIYSGTRRQLGGSFFGNVKRYMAPIGQTAMRGFKTAARVTTQGVKAAGRLTAKGIKAAAKNKVVQDIAKKALEQGVAIGTNVAVDALQGRNVGDALKVRAKEQALQALTGTPAPNDESQILLPPPRRGRKRVRIARRKLKQNTSPKIDIKSSTKSPPAKRRRKTLSRARLNRDQLF